MYGVSTSSQPSLSSACEPMHGGQLGAAEVSHPCACYVTEPALTPTSHEHAILVTGPLACVSAAFVGSASRTGARQDDQLALPAVVSPERFANQHAVAAPGGLTHGAAAGRSIRPPPIRQCPGSALASVPVSLLDAHLFVSTASEAAASTAFPPQVLGYCAATSTTCPLHGRLLRVVWSKLPGAGYVPPQSIGS